MKRKKIATETAEYAPKRIYVEFCIFVWLKNRSITNVQNSVHIRFATVYFCGTLCFNSMPVPPVVSSCRVNCYRRCASHHKQTQRKTHWIGLDWICETPLWLGAQYGFGHCMKMRRKNIFLVS